jgi:predicted nucleic acid-binding protein
MTDQPPFVYVDSNVFMYAVEGVEAASAPVKELFAILRERPGIAATSELTLAEVLPKAAGPHRRMYFHLIVWSGIFDLRPVARQILVETADYRRALTATPADGRTSMPKLPDAIHVVTAIHSGCRRLLSRNHGMKAPEGLQLLRPDDRGVSLLMGELQ